MPTAPEYSGPIVARRAPARRRPLASAEPASTPARRPLPALASLVHESWQEYADSCLDDLEKTAKARARHRADYDADVRDWGTSPGRESLFLANDEADRRRLIGLARRAGAALVEAGWDRDEAARLALETARLALETAGLIPAPAEVRPAPAPRSLLGEVAELSGRVRPARVGRDAALDGRAAEAWRPAAIRPAPTPEKAPAMTPRQVAALRKRERAANPPTTPGAIARAERNARREEELAEQARRDRDQRRRVSGK